MFKAENHKYKEHMREKNAPEPFLRCQKCIDSSVVSSQESYQLFFLHSVCHIAQEQLRKHSASASDG